MGYQIHVTVSVAALQLDSSVENARTWSRTTPWSKHLLRGSVYYSDCHSAEKGHPQITIARAASKVLTHQPGPSLFTIHDLCLQVRDIVFLHKYNEPVLLILHEVEPTWPARYRDTKDTMALAALSVNVVHKRHPRIWEASGLPSDTLRLIPVPTGGALALSQNMIIYHTQVPVPALQ